MQPLALTLAALMLAAPAVSTAADVRGGAAVDRILLRGGAVEEGIHASRSPDARKLGGMDRSPDLRDFLPVCKGSTVTELPPTYVKNYRASDKENAQLLRVATRLRRYRNISSALKAGYLPTEGYELGKGLALAHPKRIPAVEVSWYKPSVLFYIRDRRKTVYRLAGAAYVKGGAVRPKKRFKVAKKGRKNILRQWRPWNKVCWWKIRGMLIHEDATDQAGSCDGNYMDKGWMLHLWLPLANPLGIFTPRNPGVDYIDLQGKAFPYCNG